VCRDAGFAREQEVTIQEACTASEDFADGARAVAEKRAPQFAGR
jgi:enoyl-CoA hydratase/carnithine racemase